MDYYDAEYLRVLRDVLPKARQDANLWRWQMPHAEAIAEDNIAACCEELNKLLPYQPVYFAKWKNDRPKSYGGGLESKYWREARGDYGFIANIQARGPVHNFFIDFSQLDSPPTMPERLRATKRPIEQAPRRTTWKR